MTRKAGRDSYVGPPECFLLDHACYIVNKAFNETCYLVGSATETVDFRDVDVRIIMDDAKYEILLGTHHGQSTIFWTLLCTSISLYLSKQTGLRVDFQIQKRSYVSKSDWDKPRRPLGIFVTKEHDPMWSHDPIVPDDDD